MTQSGDAYIGGIRKKDIFIHSFVWASPLKINLSEIRIFLPFLITDEVIILSELDL